MVKADGLASGKGVTICKSKRQVLKISNEIFRGKFSSSKKIVRGIFEGEEASYFLIVNKNSFKFLVLLRITKSWGKDTGPNTGGMGAYSAPIINKNIEKKK